MNDNVYICINIYLYIPTRFYYEGAITIAVLRKFRSHINICNTICCMPFNYNTIQYTIWNIVWFSYNVYTCIVYIAHITYIYTNIVYISNRSTKQNVMDVLFEYSSIYEIGWKANWRGWYIPYVRFGFDMEKF